MQWDNNVDETGPNEDSAGRLQLGAGDVFLKREPKGLIANCYGNTFLQYE